MNVRLNAYVAQCSRFSRRKADTLILEGKVSVNGIIVRLPYHRVQKTDHVSLFGQAIVLQDVRYVMLNKPPGYTCTCSDRYADHKVTELLPDGLSDLYPVGRLDKNSRGLLLMTNDGVFCNRMTHPRFQIEKEYVLRVSPPVKGEDLKALNRHKGVVIDGQKYRLASVTEDSRSEDISILRVIAQEGKKRHLRVVFSWLGYMVQDLCRVRIGGLHLGTLEEGSYRALTEHEKNSLMKME